MKLDLLINATVVDDAIRFVSQKSKENLGPYFNNNSEEDKGSKEPDLQTGETTAATINHVF
jgi:hypothetical protein